MILRLPVETIVGLLTEEVFGPQGYQIKREDLSNGGVKLQVSNLTDTVTVTIHRNSRIQLQPNDSPFAEELKSHIGASVAARTSEMGKASCHVYKILDDGLRTSVHTAFNSDPRSTSLEEDSKFVKYRFGISDGPATVTLTYYQNGTVLVQGISEPLFHEVCSKVENLGQQNASYIAARFVSHDPESVDTIAKLLTPELWQQARERCETSLGRAYTFLSEYDQKLAETAFALLDVPLVLPEYSYVVMPLAKCFEGYLTRLLISLRLTTQAEVESQGWNFGGVWGKDLKSFYAQGKDHKAYLIRLKAQVPFCRHFYQHSDMKGAHEVTDMTAARDRIGRIATEIRDSCEYFHAP